MIEQKPQPAEKPDLILGIDFGHRLTSEQGTAVAWALTDRDKVNSIRLWPPGQTEAQKAPSAVVLGIPDAEAAWGFATRNHIGSVRSMPVYTLFKGWIGAEVRKIPAGSLDGGPPKMDAQHEELGAAGAEEESEDKLPQQVGMNARTAEECLQKYLSGLYRYIESFLDGKLPDGKDLAATNTWFLFSYPTTWRSGPQKRFQDVVLGSSFAQEGNHYVKALALDEAQAAMASVSSEHVRMRAHQGILIVDIGGSTTDVNTFTVKNDDGKKVQLEVDKDPTGKNLGSVYIDNAVGKSLKFQVESAVAKDGSPFSTLGPEEKRRLVESTVVKILVGQYPQVKHDFNPEKASTHRTLRHPIYANSSENAPSITITFEINQVLKNKFKGQCDKIWKQIEGHLEFNRLPRNKAQSSSRTFGKPVFVPDPELAVSKGLVFDALESVNRSGLWRYRSRYCYGIAACDSDGKVEVTKLLENGQVVNIKDFRRKEYVKFELADGNTANLKLVRWCRGEGKDETNDRRILVGDLMKDFNPSTPWKQWMWSSKTKTAKVKLSCERWTLTVSITDGNGTNHPLVFNEEWHEGTVVKSNPTSRRKRMGQYGDAAEGLSWLAALLVFFIPIPGEDEDETTEA